MALTVDSTCFRNPGVAFKITVAISVVTDNFNVRGDSMEHHEGCHFNAFLLRKDSNGGEIVAMC